MSAPHLDGRHGSARVQPRRAGQYSRHRQPYDEFTTRHTLAVCLFHDAVCPCTEMEIFQKFERGSALGLPGLIPHSQAPSV